MVKTIVRSLRFTLTDFYYCKQALLSRLQVQQTFFVPAKKKHELGEEHDTCLLLKS